MLDVVMGVQPRLLMREAHVGGAGHAGRLPQVGTQTACPAHGMRVPRALGRMLCARLCFPSMSGSLPQGAPCRCERALVLSVLPPSAESSLSPSIVFSVHTDTWGALNDGDTEAC